MKTFIQNRLTVDAVIFDLDGTLIDSVDFYCKVLNLALKRLGLPAVSRERISKAVVDGIFDWDRVLPVPMKAPKNELVAKLVGVISEIYPRMFRTEVKMIEGAGGILREIARSGMKIGLVTSTPRRLLEEKLRPLRGSGSGVLFDVIITTDDVVRKKPAADPLLECGRRLGVNMDRTVYVGDARTDLKAARTAGMKSVGVLTGIDDYRGLMSENPYAVIESVVGLRNVINSNVQADLG